MTETTPSVGFFEAVKLFFTNYANFKGRARRSEYWNAIVFVNVISSILTAALPEVGAIWSLITLLPGLAIVVRRLHDTGRSGWYYFIALIPLVGVILMLVWLCSDSTEDNQWGPNPKKPASYGGASANAALPSSNSYNGGSAGGSYGSTAPSGGYAPPAPAAPKASSNITLRLCTGPMAGAAYSCAPGSYATLGRAPSRCEIVLDQQYNMVSGVHCRIAFYDNYATVTDLNSTNGTFLNGTRLNPGEPMTAQNGATIYLASSACAFQIYFN